MKYYNYLLENVSENFKELEKSPAPCQDKLDKVAWEGLFHQLPQDQLEVFVCLYLGLKPLEIVEALNLQNIARFYNVNAKLKKIYRQQNWRILNYN